MDDTRIHDWRAKCLYAYEDPGISHIKCYMASAIIGDERLLRGEILCLLRLFRGRLRNKGMENHVIAPVCHVLQGPCFNLERFRGGPLPL